MDHLVVLDRAVRGLHGVPWRAGAPQAAPALSDRVLCAPLAGRRGRRAVRRAGRAEPVPRLLRVPDRPRDLRAGGRGGDGARSIWPFSTPQRYAVAVALAAALAVLHFSLRVVMRETVDGYQVVAPKFLRPAPRHKTRAIPDEMIDAARKLLHGVINHGQQMLREEHRRQPVTYFCPGSGIGRAMTGLEGAPRRIGILGSAAARSPRTDARATLCASTRSIRWCWTSRGAISAI